ncbi:MAG: hypothetical protein QOC70_1397 [Verrucomicrobiota bacterium]
MLVSEHGATVSLSCRFWRNGLLRWPFGANGSYHETTILRWGGLGGTRTRNQRLKRALLYH